MKKTPRNTSLPAFALAFSLLAADGVQAGWIKSYGTKGVEYGTTLAPSPKGGYYLSAISSPATSTTKSAALLSLLSNQGKPIWTKKITTGAYDTFYLSELNNGRILLQGTTAVNDGPADAVWAVYNVNRATGALSPVFKKAYKGKGDEQLIITQDSQGVLWGTGTTTSFSSNGRSMDMVLAKIDANTGIPAWSKVYNYGYDDSIVAFIPKGDNFILLADSQTATADSKKILLGQLNKLGVPVSGSFKEYGGTGLRISALNIKPISGGNYLVSGNLENSLNDKYPRLFVMKLNSNLGYVWAKSYAGGSDQGLHTAEVNENADKSLTLTTRLDTALYINIGGQQFPFGALAHPTVIQLSSNGAVISTKSFEYKEVDSSRLSRIANGDYLLGGFTSDAMDPNKPAEPQVDMLYGRFNPTLAPAWVKTLAGPLLDSGFISQKSTGYLLSGETMSWGAGNVDVLAGDLDANGDVPGCPYIKEVAMAETAPTITATNLNWQPKAASLIRKGSITAADIVLNVTNGAITTTNICSN
ncbi:MAG: hypothetical protein WAW36_14550 [Methylovulum miyakonense]|uniref:hypothetical protein n=1 Tax=Methylovulum miyakonense TaxID=645578 RepID=UPI003BB76991